MWFKTISLILAIACYIEGVAGLLFRRQFDAWIRQQFSAPTPSVTLRLLLMYAMLLVLATWYATFVHYTTHGWVLTLLMTLVGIEVLACLWRWKSVAAEVVNFFETAGRALNWVYLAAVLLGVLLLWLGLFVY